MSKRVVIIGAGVIGLCTAYYCARRGFDVTIVEREPARRNGTSFGNAGMIVPSHFIPLAAPGMVALGLKWMGNPASPFYIKPCLDAGLIGWAFRFWRAANAEHVRRSAPLLRDLLLASRAGFEDLAALPGVDFGLVKQGLLMLCRTQHALDEEAGTAQKARELGLPADVLDAKQAAALDPGARLDIAGAVHFPMDAHLTPERLIAALQSQLEQLGVKFLWEREARDFWTSNGRVRAVILSDGLEIAADEFVLCGGVWSPQLARKLALRLPMEAGKGYSLTLPRPRVLPRLCSILTEARVAVTPMDGALRVGGTMEIAGLDESISALRVRGIIDSFCRYFPEFAPADFDGVQPWSGLRPCSPDGLPYLGRTAHFANLTVAAGHAMMGVSLGPISGRLVAEILSGETPSHDLTMLSPNRYS
jgi:D-amino-acid dehydrogenase